MNSNQDNPGMHQGPLNVAAIREAARDLESGAVPSGYKGNREEIIEMLNAALATELVCALRYKRHYYTATGLVNEPIKAEFLQHAQEEEEQFWILRMMAEGYSGAEIARQLGISTKTVDAYKRRVEDKLGLRHRTDYVRFAIEAGILGP